METRSTKGPLPSGDPQNHSGETAAMGARGGDDSSSPPVLAAKSISKHYGGVQALKEVDLTLVPGEIHALVGENGAGKSTLMRVCAGLTVPDEGVVEVDGVPIEFTPHAARDAGIALVHQELSLVPQLPVAENVCLGDLPRDKGLVRWQRVFEETKAALKRLGVKVDPWELVENLPLATRQYIEIAKALRQDPHILILDEPTATLTTPETAALIELLKSLSRDGISVLFISHRIPEIFDLCTRATVLRDGKNVDTYDLTSTTHDDIVRAMVGRDVLVKSHETRQSGEVLLQVEKISGDGVNGVSFSVRRGEVLGVGGLVGAGRSELVRAAIGLEPREKDQVTMTRDGVSVPVTSYLSAIREGIAFVPEERGREGLALALSLESNLCAPSTSELSRFGFLHSRSMRSFAQGIMEKLGVRAGSVTSLGSSLSGGNQQKVALGKWLGRNLDLLVLDEPTRGVDIGAKEEIHDLIRQAADQGLGVVMVSSDLPELLGLSDRIIVMKDGEVTGEVTSENATEEVVMQLATGRGDTA